MNMSFAEMVTAIRDYVSAQDSQVELIKTEINLAYKDLARNHNWTELHTYLDSNVTAAITLVSGQAYIALPADAIQLLGVSDITNDYPLEEISGREIVEDNVTLLDTNGQVLKYANLGPKPIKRPLSVADTVDVITESSSDTSVDVRISGLRNDVDLKDRETITTASSTPQSTAVTGALTYKKGWSIHTISVGPGLNGWVRVRESTTTTNVLAEVTEHERNPEYVIMFLENPPDSAPNLSLVYKRDVLVLVDDDDRPEIPVDRVIIETVRGKLRQVDRAYDMAANHFIGASQALESALSQRKAQSPRRFQIRPDTKRRGLRRAY
jgi:hypothetical protein